MRGDNVLRAVTEGYLRRSGLDIKLDHGVNNMAMSGPIFLRAATAANGLPLVEFGSSHCA